MKNYKFNEIIQRWKNGEKFFLVSDGAMGTTLQKAGLQPGTCPEEWNLSHPDVIREIHKGYFDVGADIVTTNTMNANRISMRRYGLEDKIKEMNQEAVKIAKSVCPEGKFVGGSIGPTGEMLEPLGSLTYDEVKAAYKEQIQFMVDADIDIIIIETQMDVNEAKLAVSAAKEINPNLPVFATMTFEKSAFGYHTMMGVSPKDAVENLSAAGADVLGANCGRGLEEMIEIMREFRKLTDMPLLSQANAGLPQIIDGRTCYSETPEQRAEGAKKLLEIGINIIGGCCGTTKEHINEIRKIVDNYQ